MRGAELHRLAEETALELPQSELTYPFGPDWEVYKVVGKVFLLLTRAAGPQMVTFKVEPREGRALVGAFDNVVPGYHMNKTHWVTVLPSAKGRPCLPAEELEELIVSSYLLVVAGLAKKERPVDPYAFGAARDRRSGREAHPGPLPR